MTSSAFWATKGIAKMYTVFEKVTGIPACALVEQSGVLSASTPIVLDNAAGTGIVTSLLQADAGFRSRVDKIVVLNDLSPDMVASAVNRAADENWVGTECKVGDAQDMEHPEHCFSHVLTNFGIFLIPDPIKGLQECRRVTQPGGVVGFTTWVTVGWTALANLAISRLPQPGPPAFEPSDVWRKKGLWDEPTFVKSTLESLDFEEIRVERLPFTYAYKEKAALLDALEQGFLKQITLTWSEQEQAEQAPRLPDLVREAFAELYPGETVDLAFEALVVTARKPAT